MSGPERSNPDVSTAGALGGWRILDAVRESVLVTGTELERPGPRILYVNAAFTRIFGYAPDEVIGRTPRLLQGSRTDRRVLVSLRERLGAGEPFTGETINYRKDGAPLRVRWYIEPLRLADGTITHWVGVQRDVTAERAAERFTDRLLEAMAAFDDGAVLLDASGFVEFANEPFAELFGWHDAGAINGRRLSAALPLGPLRPGFERAVAQEQRWVRDLVLPREARSGGVDRVVELTLAPRGASQSGPKAYCCTAREVTEQRRVEQRSAALSMTENLGFIFAGIRHELGNPVNSLKAALSVLRPNWQRFAPEKVSFYLGRALEEVERMEYLLGSLRSYGALEVPHLEPVRFAEWLPRFVALVKRDVAGHSVQLRTELQPGLVAMAEPRSLNLVVSNLVRNAVEAMDGEDGEVALRVARRDSWIVLEVEDDGPGIAEEELERVLLPFHTTKARGTGMGLVVVRRLVAKMNGALEVQSAPGQGTTMRVLLPPVDP